jgi:cell division protein ZapA
VTVLPEDNNVIVRIFGEEYPITGSADSAYISRIADAVDSRMQEVSERSRTKVREKVAILTALSFASELQEKSDQVQTLSSSQESTLDDMLSLLDRALTDEPPAGI